MTTAEIITMAAGFGLPMVIAPLAYLALRPLFAFFVAEGAELIGGLHLTRDDVSDIAQLVAKLDVVVLLVAWQGIFACACFNQPVYLTMGIALAAVISAISVTFIIVRAGLDLDRGQILVVSLIAFTGGNLPIIVLGGAAAALL